MIVIVPSVPYHSVPVLLQTDVRLRCLCFWTNEIFCVTICSISRQNYSSEVLSTHVRIWDIDIQKQLHTQWIPLHFPAKGFFSFCFILQVFLWGQQEFYRTYLLSHWYVSGGMDLLVNTSTSVHFFTRGYSSRFYKHVISQTYLIMSIIVTCQEIQN